MARGLLRVLCVGAFLFAALVPMLAAENETYITGGPLAGLELSPNKVGQWGEVELYSGSVEHYRAYMTKYLPVRSFFDQQSMLKIWVAPNIPGAEGKRVEQFKAPIYKLDQSSTGGRTDKFWPPVEVIRCKVKVPVFKLDLGELDVGLYAVRVVAAVETEKLRRFREPLYVTMRINDGPKGEVGEYRLRIGYVDDFYSVAEIYFHAVEKRRFQAELFVDEGSKVDLLVHNITLDDVLAGTTRQALKTKATLHGSLPAPTENPAVARLKPLSREERLSRDEAIWKWLPPLNAQGEWLDMNVPIPGVTYGTGDPKEKEFGAWEAANITNAGLGGVLNYDPRQYDAFLFNKKLGLRYTIDDLIARKPLPDPFPYKDDGSGLFLPDPTNPEKGYEFAPIAHEVGRRLRGGFGMALGGGYLWRRTGNKDIGRDAAVSLIRFAYQYPTIDAANWFACIAVIPSAYGRDLRCRQREECARWMPHYENYLLPLYAYDALFDYIEGNEDLAASIHRFVPWVKTSEDVIKLFDVYLVQTEAKRIMRYHDHTKPMALAEVATTVGNTAVTNPWMEWLFSRTFIYPMDPAGIQDLMISGCDRNGPQYIGSTYYAQGEGAAANAAGLERYIAAGGNPKYDLGNAAVYPKPLAQCRWQLGIMIGGLDFARIGDVCGPDKYPGATVPELGAASRRGWKWSAQSDPRFAWLLFNLYGRQDESDQEWTAIRDAAGKVKRAPWLDNKSRALNNWFGALETGLQHDDYRFRRAVYLRTGMGYGHQHADTLDLQVVAHGMPMTIEGGQRSGYSKPNDRFSRIHNVVEVNGQGNEEFGLRSHSWVQTLSDAAGARYLQANAVPPNVAKLFRRQAALIDVDEESGSKPLPVDLQKPGVRLDPGVATANSYVFDVFRVSGGQAHAYCFHGMVNDDFQWNAKNPVKVPSVKSTYDFSGDENYLSIFPDSPDGKLAGIAPETLEVTWRCTRDGKQGSEQRMLGVNFNDVSPRKFTRLHLLGAADIRALKAESISEKFGYHYTNFMGLRRGTNLESAFAALIEPYAGEPFIAGQRLLEIADNEKDALRAVAVEVKTKNGRTDICFADGRPDTVRKVGNLQVAGEFAFYSTDGEGFRQATLTGGSVLEGPDVRIRMSARERTAKVTEVDYLKKTFKIDAPWPAACGGRVYEIGSPERMTCYTATAVTPQGQGATVTLDEGADFFRSPIRRVNPGEGTAACVLSFSLGKMKGLDKNWVASNDRMTKFWRADQVAGNVFKLVGGPVAEADFAPTNVLRLWEYGVGDTLRQSTFASLRRIEKGVYELTGDVDLTVSLKAKALEISSDGTTWKSLEGTRKGEWLEVPANAALLGSKPVYLKAVQ